MKTMASARTLAPLAALALLSLIAGSARAQDGAPVETFDDPALPGWERTPNAIVADGVLRIQGEGYAIRPDAQVSGGLILRLRFEGDGFLEVRYRISEAGMYILRLSPGEVALVREGGGRQVTLASAPSGQTIGEWWLLEIGLAGPEQHIFLGPGVEIHAVDDEPLTGGGSMLHVFGQAVGEFDDLTLIGSGAPPSPPALTPPAEAPAASGVPAYQAGAWIRLGGPPGGLGYDIRMQPDNPDIMYVTDGFTGTYKSVDGGLSWFPVNEGVETSPGAGTTTFCATIDPHDHDSVWIGLQLSGHIYRSPDSGQSWEQRDSGLIFEDCLRSVRGITIDPNDPDVMFAGVEVDSRCWSELTISRRQGVVRGEVYRSADAGLTWTRVWDGENLARYIWIDPRDSDRVYVSTGIFDRDAYNSDIPNNVPGGVGILRSDDGGLTWEVLDGANGLGGLYVPSLFMHPEDPDTLLAAVTAPAIKPGGEGAYVTRDGGDTWRRILSLGPGIGVDVVEISGADPDVWYAGTENRIYRSDDAGATWGQFAMGMPDRESGMPIDLQVDPRDPLRIFVNSYSGGNMMSADGGQTWEDASHGYSGLRVHTIAVAPGSGWMVFANEFRSDNGGQTWSGTGMASRSLVILPGEDDTRYRLLSAATYGLFGSSQDGGLTWQSAQIADTDGAPFSAVLAAAPSNPQILYLGYFHWNCGPSRSGGSYELCFHSMPGMLRSQDGGLTWQAVQVPVNHSILTLAVQPNDPQTVYAGTARGLYTSRDGASTWEYVDGVDDVASSAAVGNPDLQRMPAPSIADILFDPSDPETIYVASRPGAVLRSRDGGESWEQTASGLDPNEPVNDLLADPSRPGVLYAGSSLSGVFVSIDGGATWQAVNNGLERRDVAVLALSQDGTVLYAGTASGNGGSGIWRLGTPAGEPQGSQPPVSPMPAIPQQAAATPLPDPGLAGAPARRLPAIGLVLGVVIGSTLLVALVLASLRIRRR